MKKEKSSPFSPAVLAGIWSVSAVCWIAAAILDFSRSDSPRFLSILHVVCALLSVLNAVIYILYAKRKAREQAPQSKN